MEALFSASLPQEEWIVVVKMKHKNNQKGISKQEFAWLLPVFFTINIVLRERKRERQEGVLKLIVKKL